MLAKNDGHKHIYISTGETGLYEKYGYHFWKIMKDVHGEDSRVYKTDIVTTDYKDVLGITVSGTIDRPLGSAHPRHPEMIYPINYGYVDGVLAGDGAEQDVYVFGTDQPLEKYTGKVVAVYHRLNDNEDKWIIEAMLVNIWLNVLFIESFKRRMSGYFKMTEKRKPDSEKRHAA